MKLSKFKFLLIVPSVLITACGYGLKETYEGVPYNTTDFFKNYFNVWNNDINPNNASNKITEKYDEYALDEEKDKVFTSTNTLNFKSVENNWVNYVYEYDKEEPEQGKAYGPAVKLSGYDSSFKYGIASKMFDGQMFCNGDYANARTQVEPINQGEDKGLGVLFSKESSDASYIMMNFKCSVVLKDNQNLPTCESEIELHIGLYFKNDNGYTYVPVKYTISNVPTNSGDSHSEQRFSMYRCFGFSLENFKTEHLIGFSVQYKKIADTYSTIHPDETTYHALMLYEVSFPHTTWN